VEQLTASLGRRLDELAVDRPDLSKALELQRDLLSRQIELLDVFGHGGLPGLALPAGYVSAKLRKSIPALHGEPIPLPARVLELSARDFCQRLAHGGAGEAALAIDRALDRGAIDAAALVSACFGRDQRRVRFIAGQQNVSADLVWLVAELALAPFAHLLQTSIFGTAAVAESIRGWDRGYCPACGSWPAIAEVVGGRHGLRCSFCAAGWGLASYRCIYCGVGDERFITLAPDPETPGRRLQACNACGGYLKALELREPTEFPLVAIEDLASMDLDMVAIERKYVRPALPEIKKR
jgi:FdhE protein